jgi:YbgC/YbaW family acyl-CoA thioester hydrolase
MNRQDFRSFTRIEVRWAEVDAQKIVFNAHYLMYADVAITNYWRQLAIPYEAGFASLGGELFVKKASTVYHGSATLGDVLDVGIRCVKQGNTSLQFEAGIFRGMELLNTVELVYVFADAATQTPGPCPRPCGICSRPMKQGRRSSRCARAAGTTWGATPSACAWPCLCASRACRARSRLTSSTPWRVMWCCSTA